MSNLKDKSKEAFQVINGIETDILMHLSELIEVETDIQKFSAILSQKTGITFSEAEKLIKTTLSR